MSIEKQGKYGKYKFDIKLYQWKKKVLRKFGFKCVKCGRTGNNGTLEGHHIKSKFLYPELKYDINNGVSLCPKCHNWFHIKFGIDTKLDLDTFLINFCSVKEENLKGESKILLYTGDYFRINPFNYRKVKGKIPFTYVQIVNSKEKFVSKKADPCKQIKCIIKRRGKTIKTIRG